ncbi:DUF3460 family protein [Paraburkholderia sp. SARCC-3016]|uniref:DUF3460 family protein n=1 Tax=Paraburkholderia sp. SARCC-3016 TaxID=3058611 RepID=UPI00280971EE|nr:DUF3460 family protein [Paraburkholderia sp. SARCC-3016]MDQ7981558.1 DUF3460 family protein [Paraburkholderia sp. SARCC-3016]
MYQSDVTQFLNSLKTKNPRLEEEQRKGRALLWDKQPVDLDEQAAARKSRVAQPRYPYFMSV